MSRAGFKGRESERDVIQGSWSYSQNPLDLPQRLLNWRKTASFSRFQPISGCFSSQVLKYLRPPSDKNFQCRLTSRKRTSPIGIILAAFPSEDVKRCYYVTAWMQGGRRGYRGNMWDRRPARGSILLRLWGGRGDRRRRKGGGRGWDVYESALVRVKRREERSGETRSLSLHSLQLTCSIARHNKHSCHCAMRCWNCHLALKCLLSVRTLYSLEITRN